MQPNGCPRRVTMQQACLAACLEIIDTLVSRRTPLGNRRDWRDFYRATRVDAKLAAGYSNAIPGLASFLETIVVVLPMTFPDE